VDGRPSPTMTTEVGRHISAPDGVGSPAPSPHARGHGGVGSLAPPPLTEAAPGLVEVCLAGAIGLHKGYFVLLACARDARVRGLNLRFTVVGHTIDDAALLDTDRVFVTGPYQRHEAVALIRAQGAALGFLPSIWPETWCLALTDLWRAGLTVAAFDIGAPAERIRRTGRGLLLPKELPAPEINDALIRAALNPTLIPLATAAHGRSVLPVGRASAYKPLVHATPSK